MATQKNVIENSVGSVGIGTTSPTQVLELKKTTGSAIALLNYNDSVKFNINASSAGAGYVGMVSNHPLLFVNNDTERMRLDTNGNLGIGTTSPGVKLQIQGLTRINADSALGLNLNRSATSVENGIHFSTAATTDWYFYVDNGNTNLQIQRSNELDDGPRLRFDGSNSNVLLNLGGGNVGIGLTSPTQKLEVAGFVMGGTSSYRTSIGANASGAYIYFGDTSNLYSLGRLGTYNSAFNINSYNGSIVFQINDSEKVRIDTNGNLGIGTSNPAGKLDVILSTVALTTSAFGLDLKVTELAGGWARSNRIYNTNYTAGTTFFGAYGGASSINYAFWTLDNPASVDVTGYNSTKGIFLNSSGNVGINTTGFTTKFSVSDGTTIAQINPSSGVAYFGTINNYPMALSVNSSEKVRIDTNGSVGIGTTSPLAKLHILGDGGSTDYVYQRWSYTGNVNTYDLLLKQTVTSGVVRYNFSMINGGTTYNDVLVLDRGCVGIGTSLPVNLLNVHGTNPFVRINNTSNGDQGIKISYNNSDAHGLHLMYNPNNAVSYIDNTYATVSGQIYGDIYFRQNVAGTMTTRMAIKADGGNVGIGTTSPAEKLNVIGNGFFTDNALFNYKIQRIPQQGNPQGGTYKGYLILAKAYTSGLVNASYVIGNVVIRRGTSGTGHNVDTYYINSSTGYNTDIFQVTSLGNISTRFVRLVKVTYGGVVYHAIETASTGGSPSTELEFNGCIVDSPLILTDESYVSNVTAYGSPIIFADQNSNVGIGTTSPGYKLDVSGVTRFQNVIRLKNDAWNVTDSDSQSRFYFDYNGRTYFGSANGYEWRSSSDSTICVLTNAGNLGIGTSSPSAKLDVVDSGTFFVSRDANAYPRFSVTNGSAQLGLFRSGTSAGGFYIGGDDTLFSVWTSGFTRLFNINNSGNVGIGTTSPSQKLYLVGAQVIENGHSDTRLQLYYPNGIEARKSYLTLWASEPGISYNGSGIGANINLSGQYYGRQNSGSAYGVYMRFDPNYGNTEFYNTTASPGSLNGQGTRVFYIDSSGNAISTGGTRSTYADIGSTAGDIYIASNLNRLGQTSVPTVESQNASKAFVINHTGAQPILFGTNGTERMRILSDGNVGIGTTSPIAKFVVNNNGGTTNAFYVDVGNRNDVTTLFEHTGTTTPVPFRLKKSGYSGTAANYGLLYLYMNDGTVGNGSNLYFTLNDSAGNEHEYGGLGAHVITNTNGAESGDLVFYTSDAGTIRSEKVRIKYNGNIGIGTSSPSSKLHIDDINAPWITISRSGTPTWQLRNNYPNNQYGFSFNNTTAGTVPLFIGAGGNVGIGLDSPAVKLDIASTQGDGIIMRYDTSTAYQAWIRPYWNSGTDTRIDFAINRSANVTPAVIMSVGYGSNVGIGTTAPAAKLDVISGSMRAATGAYAGELYFGKVDNENIYLKRDNNYDLSLVQNAASGNALYLAGAGNVYVSIDSNNNETDRAFIVQNNSVKSGTELFRVQENGNVGIGTSSPAYKLDVNGSINASTFMYVTYPYGDAYPLQLIGSSFLKANNNYYGLLIRSGDTNFISGRLSLIGGSSKRFEIHGYEETVGYIPTVIPGGNVGIGTTNPSNGTLQVYNASGNTLSLQKSGGGAALMMGSDTTNFGLLESINGGGIRFYTGNGTLTEKVRIAADGNVGIGSSSPTVKFDLYNGRMRYYDGTFSQIPNVVSYNLDNNGTGGYAIKTPFLIGSSYEMAIVHVLGYVYGSSTLVDFKVVFYDYGPSNAPINYSMVDNGNDGFVKYLAKDSSGYINICFASLSSTYYYARFTVNLYTTRYASGNYSGGWTFTQTTSANYGMSALYDITPALTTTTSAVGIGTISPAYKLQVNHSSGYGIVATDSTVSSGIYNGVPLGGITGAYFGTVTAHDSVFGANGAASYIIVKSGGNVGINTTSPGALLNVNGRFMAGGTTSDVATAHVLMNTTGVAIQYTGNTGNYLMISPGAANTTISLKADARTGAYPPMDFWTSNTSRMTILADGNVGIGTTNPGAKLYVSAGTLSVNTRASYISADITTNSSVYTHTLNLIDGSTDANPTSLALGTYSHVIFRNRAVSAGSAGGILDIYTRGVLTDPTVKMTITDVGNVGIGTTSPSYRLQVGNLTSASTSTPEILSLGGTYSNSAGSNVKLRVYDDTGTTVGGMSVSSGQMEVNTWGTGKIAFYRGSTQTAIIDNNGNVGIGTSAPTTKFEVVGAIASFLDGSNSISRGHYIANAANTRAFNFQLNAGGTCLDLWSFNSGNTWQNSVTFDAGGSVGIGTTSPAQKLDVRGYIVSDVNSNAVEGGFYLGNSGHGIRRPTGTNNVYLYTSTGTLYLGANGSSSQHITILNGGSVGIGTTSPTSALSVTGNVGISGTLSKGGGSFLIDHPDPEKVGWKLQHSFVESPTVGDNIYRFEITIDTSLSGSIELPSYWKHLNENPQIWVSPVKHFGAAYGEIDENISKLNVYANNRGKYNVLLIGTRKDPTIKMLMPEFRVEIEPK